MDRKRVGHGLPSGQKRSAKWIWLSGAYYGTGCFSGWTVKGTIGCSLSHLSILKDAYDSGYETIWILEDDIAIQQDVHLLSDRIEELDALTGENGWDVLYTDYECLVIHPDRPMEEQIPHMWRPDMGYRDLSFLAEHTDLGDKFKKIGSRMRAHSMIYRRCGIEKILNFYREHNNFLPYDQELALVPDILTYVLKEGIVSFNQIESDTRYRAF